MFKDVQSILCILLLQIYDKELESIPEFEKLDDNIKQFKIYGFNEKDENAKTVAIFKVIIINLLKCVIGQLFIFMRL